jgi:hypothetical protein
LKEALPNAKPVAVLANPPEAAGFMGGALPHSRTSRSRRNP